MQKLTDSTIIDSKKFIFCTLCVGLILGLILSDNIQKESTSEKNYFDFNIKTYSTLSLEHPRILNYTVSANYTNSPLSINSYALLETDKGFDKINERQEFLNGNFTAQYDVKLKEGKNKWSFVIEPITSNIASIIHHGEFDEIEYPLKKNLSIKK